MTFSTGLTAAEFAKQKLSYLLTLCGCVLREKSGGDGLFSYEEWRAEGVREENGLMVVYGRDAGGERLDTLLEGDKNAALSAVLLWKAALDFLQDKAIFEHIGAAPCAVFVDLAHKTLFFPPRDLIRIAVGNEGETAWLSGAKRWTHPDKRGKAAINWTFAACLYRVFAGFAPFSVPFMGDGEHGGNADNTRRAKPDARAVHPAHTIRAIDTIEDTLAGDTREGALVPVSVTAPGLREDIARFIDTQITRHYRKERPAVTLPSPFIDHDYVKNIMSLSADEMASIKARREEIERKNQKQISAKRFWARNKTLIKVVAVGVVAFGIVIGSFVQAQLERWTTKGLTPSQVVEQYYGAFGALDHETMSACVEKDVGKTDIEMVTNLFVVAKMREAYEQKQTVLNAADWDETEIPPDTTVFGVVGLALDWPGGGENGIPQDGDAVTAHARYDLVVPQSFVDGSADSAPARVFREDVLQLQWRKNRWRIAGIERRERL